MVEEVGEGKVAVMPLFVAITPGMKIVFPGEQELGGGRRRSQGRTRSPARIARDRVGRGHAATPTIAISGKGRAKSAALLPVAEAPHRNATAFALFVLGDAGQSRQLRGHLFRMLISQGEAVI